jgi:hypothetical protein
MRASNFEVTSVTLLSDGFSMANVFPALPDVKGQTLRECDKVGTFYTYRSTKGLTEESMAVSRRPRTDTDPASGSGATGGVDSK